MKFPRNLPVDAISAISSQFMGVKEAFKRFQTTKIEGLKPVFVEKLNNFFAKSESELNELEELIMTTQKTYVQVLEVYGESDYETLIPGEEVLMLFNNFINAVHVKIF